MREPLEKSQGAGAGVAPGAESLVQLNAPLRLAEIIRSERFAHAIDMAAHVVSATACLVIMFACVFCTPFVLNIHARAIAVSPEATTIPDLKLAFSLLIFGTFFLIALVYFLTNLRWFLTAWR
jgi:hypothetical protein